MAIHAGLNLYDALILCVGIFFQRRFHCCSEAAICCCGSFPPLRDIEGVVVGSFAEYSAAFIVLMGLLTFKFSPFLFELPCEVGMCLPPQLIGCLLPVVQEFCLEQATCVHLGHKVFHLVLVGNSDPMVFPLNLAPVQLARKGGDVRFWSVDPWH